MKRIAFAGGLALSLCLAACNNEPVATPDIADAIPVDEGGDEGSIDGSESSAQDQANAGSSEIPALPNAQSSSQSRTQPSSQAGSQPSTMQSGSNADGGRAADPSRTKLIPAD